MRKLCRVLMALPLICLSVAFTQAQNTQTVDQSGTKKFFQERENFEKSKAGNQYYVLLTFSHLPDKETFSALASKQIQLLELHSKNTYLVTLPANIKQKDLAHFSVIKVDLLKVEQKLSESLRSKTYPDWALQEPGRVDIAVVFHEKTAKSKIQSLLDKFEVQILEDGHRGHTTIVGRVNPNRIEDLAASPLIAHIDAVQEPVSTLNHEICVNQRVNVLNSTVPGGYNLRGEGVVVGVGDGGELGEHIDFGTRIINEANGTYSSFGNHGDHVAGTIGGAGNLNPRHRGVAPDCNLLIQKTNLIHYNTENYYNDYGMVLSNNSYGSTFNCTTNGSYNYSAQNLDWMMNNYPEVLHVFAAGNSGGGTCEPYPQSYKTVLKYYQSAKNVLTVGNVNENRIIVNSSSRGPVKDGRLKPEICGIGKNVASTGREFDYNVKGGTSMAAPAVTGTMALMVEKYRNLNGGNNPASGLMKAIACNTADDLGNPGPDYIYGYGLINGRRAIEVIENENYYSGSIYQGDNQVQNLNIPAGTKQVKLMLYWHDKEAAVYPEKALVNDLNIELISPDGTVYRPWVLNIDPEHVADPATRGIDTLNNIEQITIDDPTAGNYSIIVNGSEVPFGGQQYFVTYEIINEELIVTHPFGGESMTPGNNELIQWDTDPTNNSTFKIEYSIDGGDSWLLLAPAVEAHLRSWAWTIPSVTTDLTLVRVSKNNTTISGESATYFNILEPPGEFLAYASCNGTIQLEWEAVDYATEYEIMAFDGQSMTHLGETSANEFLVSEVSNYGDRHWFSVRAKNDNENYSERAIAKFCIPEDIEACPWEDDPILYAIPNPLRGRAKTKNGLDEEIITVRVKNVGTNGISDFAVYYSVNGEAPVEEIITSTIESGDSLDYEFSTKVDFSESGTYHVDAWVNFDNDTHNFNDSLLGQYTSVQLQNDPISLPFVESFSQVKNTEYTENVLGVKGAERWDFETSGFGKFKTSAADRYLYLEPYPVVTQVEDLANFAVLTMNMSDYNVNKDEIQLNFKYKAFPVLSGVPEDIFYNQVEIRGADEEEWIQLYNLNNEIGEWQSVENLDISGALSANGQSFSTSFQIRFAQNNNYAIGIDDLRFEMKNVVNEVVTEFTADQIGTDIVLKWKTPENLTTEFFEIQAADISEASSNGDFIKIGMINGIGTTTQPRFYSFNDTRPGKKGKIFYRLKQVDVEGNSTFSPVLVVDYDLLENTKPSTVFPNPFTRNLNINYYSNIESTVVLALFDNNGHLVGQISKEASKGKQMIPFEVNRNLPAGVYILKIINDQETTCHRLFKG